jgi:hypothetical protein
MKNPIQILLGSALLTLTACSTADVAPLPATLVTPSEVTALPSPELGALPAQYQAKFVTLRLLGTQGEGATASATLADTATWDTRTYQLGETVGRNLKLSAVRDSELELTEAGAAPRTVRAGQDLRVRVVEHEFDTAAVDQGQHQWAVKAAVMARLLARYGVGATATPIEFAGLPGIKLGAVQPGSSLSRLGFHAGDLLFELNGQPATAQGLGQLATAATQSQSQVLTVKMARGGALWERAYVVE